MPLATTENVARPTGNKPPDEKYLIAALAICGVAFAFPLYRLFVFGFRSDLFSYILLVPAVSGYFLHQQIKSMPPHIGVRSPLLGVPLALGGLAGLIAYYIVFFSRIAMHPQNSAALAGASFVASLAGVTAIFADRAYLRVAAFPLSFLVFLIPFPVAIERAVESFLQHGSTPPAHWLFQLAGTPVFREDLLFQLPNITLQVAPECSGIRSTIVLFMTSIIAGKLFLRSPWKRLGLAVFVIPLALVRNGFRIFTIGELCVRIGPHMVDSDIHHKGGSIFFALSLIPFFIVVYFLVRSERRPKIPVSLNPSS
jgi:exosortase C (VPDSG-CTERM-specific)